MEAGPQDAPAQVPSARPTQRPPKTPRWVWLLVGGLVVAVVAVVGMHVAGIAPGH
ncbi:MAG: hypothetical protein LC620_02960 [Halobacteriales archaeon]|nr:hypothetical protein [Halobacteriales archaeon]